MTPRNDGGPVFPVEMTYTSEGAHGKQTGHTSGWETGMSLRDYFAAKAMQGFYAGMSDTREAKIGRKDLEEDAALFYAVADAMIAAREET